MEKSYQKSHPWLTFELELRALPRELWFDLGECVSKVEHLERTAMSPELRMEIYDACLIKGAAATTAIEGNTLGEEGVRQIADGSAPAPAESYRYQYAEVKNVLGLFDRIFAETRSVGAMSPLLPRHLHQFQREILAGLPIEGNIGRVRERSVVVNGYRGAPHEDCEHLLEQLCEWLRKGACFKQLEDELGPKGAGIVRAIVAHLYVAWIHPYDDGNGRTARMAEFYVLATAGVSAAAAHLLSNHCNRLRSDYYRELARASEQRSAAGFVRFMVRGLRDELREQLKFVHKEHERLVWADFVGLRITGSAVARERRVELARVMQRLGKAHSAEELFEFAVVQLMYATKKNGMASLHNDLRVLRERKIAIADANGGKGVRANADILRGWKPAVGGAASSD